MPKLCVEVEVQDRGKVIRPLRGLDRDGPGHGYPES